ncbi:phage protease [Rhizobium sp. PDO1-076]|uniref:phage protease n=1 Tax=Rhizobium sp. PDO1-076 TaxID=1125979 RepID=UPI0002D4B35A|nr:phage protease [Rhizobium sp. PDO1-076]
MRNSISTFTIALQSAGTEVPEWLHVLPSGRFTGVDGRGPYFLENPDEVVGRFNSEGRKLPIDENHSTDLAGKQGFSSPARGWIVEMQSRTDGIWARVEWTPAGHSLMGEKAYGYLSPVFTHPRKPPFVVQRLQSVALTNDPNLTSLTSLHSTSMENTMDLEALRKALGLPETADDAAIIAAAHAAHTAQAAHTALLPRLAEVAGVAATTAPDALVTALQAKATPPASIAAENADLKEQVTSLNSRLTELVTTTSKERAVSVVDAAINATKLVPALRDHFIARHMKNPAEVETEIGLMPALNAGGLGNRQPAVTGETATSEELSVASMMGVDPEAFQKEHKALFGKGQ